MPDLSTDHQPEPPPEVIAEQQAADARAATAEAALRPELARLAAQVAALEAAADPTATAPQPAPLDLDAIEARAGVAAPSRLRVAIEYIPEGQIRRGAILIDGDTIREAIRAACQVAYRDVPALAAEVRWLRDQARADAADFRRERAILHWAAVAGQLRRWADELDAAPAGRYELPAEPPPEHEPGVQPDWCGYMAGKAAEALRQLGHTGLAEHVEHLERAHAAGNPQHLYGDAGPLSTTPPAGTEGDRDG